MAADLNQVDLDVRLDYLAIYIGTFAAEVANDIYQGKKAAICKLRTLKLLIAYMEVVKDYIPLEDDVVEEDDNFITEQQCKDIFEHMSILTGLVFSNPGYSYKPALT